MRIDENILLMRSKTFFKSQKSLDWKEIAELTAGVLDRWKIRMALFDLDEKGCANLKFHSMDGDSENWWEEIGQGSVKRLSIPLAKLPPMEECVANQKVVFVANLAQALGESPIKDNAPQLGAVFAPLMDEEKPFGVLVAMSPELKQEDALIISLIAHELSALIGGSELIRQLRQSELYYKRVATKYRDLIDRLDDAIVMADTQGAIMAVNERLRQILDYTYQDLMQKNLRDIILAEDYDTFDISIALARKTSTSAEIRLVDRNGKAIRAEAMLTFSPEANTFQGIFREEKAVEEVGEARGAHWLESVADKRTRKKKDYELLFEANMNNLPGLVFFMNPEGKIMLVNESCEKVTGYPRDDFMQHPLRWLERVHPLDREKIALAYQNALLSGQGHGAIGFKFHNRYGKECKFISTAIPLKDASGNLLGIEGIFQDITPVFEEGRQVDESARRRSLLFDNFSDLIFVFDLTYNIQVVNPSCADFFGYNDMDMVGMSLDRIIAAPDMEKLRKGVKAAIEKGQVEGIVVKAHDKNGQTMHLEINATPVIEDGKPVAIRGIARNVTERVGLQDREKALEKELHQKEKMAAIGELLATVSHGIRNPLASIRAVAQDTIEETAQDSAARVSFKNIIIESDRLETRIREFLSFYKPFEPDLKQHRINDIIAESLAMVAGKQKDLNINLDLNLDWSVPPLLLDFAQIEQVLLNLISNAFAAMPDGGILKISSMRVGGEFGERVEISIEDSGPGIPPEVQERVFQPFFTTKPHGTGMGLSVSKKIVENHGGGIMAENAPQGGARLVFWIPLLELEEDVEKEDDET